MKKVLFVGVIAIFAMLSACNSKSNDSTIDNQQTEIVEQNDSIDDNAGGDFGAPAGMPVVVDFYATWCGPCQQLTPIMEELEKKYQGKVYFVRVDVDEQPELAAKYGIESIPTLIYIDDDGEQEMTVGLLPKDKVEEKIIDILD